MAITLDQDRMFARNTFVVDHYGVVFAMAANMNLARLARRGVEPINRQLFGQIGVAGGAQQIADNRPRHRLRAIGRFLIFLLQWRNCHRFGLGGFGLACFIGGGPSHLLAPRPRCGNFRTPHRCFIALRRGRHGALGAAGSTAVHGRFFAQIGLIHLIGLCCPLGRWF